MYMPVVKLSYNPFTVESQFWINDKLQEDRYFKELCSNKRLQQWIDKVFPEFFKVLNTQEIKFFFNGTDLDAIDVKDAIDAFNKNNPTLNIVAEYDTVHLAVEDRLSKLKQLFEDAQSGPFDEFRSPEMHAAFEKALAPGFEVNVLATMSAGKSTVINAMLGQELMPAKNEACTATIAKITDYDDMDHFELRRFNHQKELIIDWVTPEDFKATSELIDQWNSDPKTSVIEIKGDIPAIDERDGVQIVLVDTPGPNNSRDAEHRATTTRAIRDTQPSMVLYILNATQLSTDDDKGLLNLIRDAMQSGGREAQDRFIFVANKIDNFDPEKGESISRAIKNVKTYLAENGITNPIVIPASAELAKLVRMSRYNGTEFLSRKQKSSLLGFVDLFVQEPEMDLVEHAKSELDRVTYQNLRDKVSAFKAQKDDLQVAEILSGIPIIESLLDNYIAKHAIPSRIKDAVDTFKSVESRSKAIETLNEVISSSDAELQNVTQAIEAFSKSAERIEQASLFREKLMSLPFTFSKEANASKREIDRKIAKLSDQLQETFTDDLTPQQAERILEDGLNQLNDLASEIEDVLSRDCEVELMQALENLRYEYQKSVASVLDKAFPTDSAFSLARMFQASTLEMADSKTMLQSASYSKKVSVKIGTERHGFLWLKKRDVYQTKQIEMVNLSETANDMLESLLELKRVNFTNFEETVRKNFQEAKNCIISQMDDIDYRLKSTIEQLLTAQNDQKQKEIQLKENKEKLDWYIRFNNNLQSILVL
ncbi:dynamin family protein [Alishewanella longhuensis]